MRGLRRRMKLNKYKRLEYLEFINFFQNYISLGMNTTPKMSIEIKCSVIAGANAPLLSTLVYSYGDLLSIGKNNAGAIGYNLKSTRFNEIGLSNGKTWTIQITSLSQSIKVVYKDNFAQLGVNYGLENPLVIGTNKGIQNNWCNLGGCKLDYLKIDDGNGRKMDLHPVKRLKDGKNGLLDRVSGKFFDFTGMVKKQ